MGRSATLADPDRLPPAQGAGGDGELHLGPDGDVPGAVGDLRAVERVPGPVGLDVAEAAVLVEGRHHPGEDADAHAPQWTILEIGSSMMSVAPWSFSAGIR